MTNDDKSQDKMEYDPRKALSEAIDLIIKLLQIVTESDNTKVV